MNHQTLHNLHVIAAIAAIWLGIGPAWIGLCKTVRARNRRKVLRAELAAEAERLAEATRPLTADELGDLIAAAEGCDPRDPCRTIFNNDADRGEFRPCGAHYPAEGRHHRHIHVPQNVIVADLRLWEQEMQR